MRGRQGVRGGTRSTTRVALWPDHFASNWLFSPLHDDIFCTYLRRHPSRSHTHGTISHPILPEPHPNTARANRFGASRSLAARRRQRRRRHIGAAPRTLAGRSSSRRGCRRRSPARSRRGSSATARACHREANALRSHRQDSLLRQTGGGRRDSHAINTRSILGTACWHYVVHCVQGQARLSTHDSSAPSGTMFVLASYLISRAGNAHGAW
jgi:hypothetical protein